MIGVLERTINFLLFPLLCNEKTRERYEWFHKEITEALGKGDFERAFFLEELQAEVNKKV